MKAKGRTKSKAAVYPRDMVGYGKRLPDPKWPGQARLALQISAQLRGRRRMQRAARRQRLRVQSDRHRISGGQGRAQHAGRICTFEYGSRRGVWRLLRLFEERKIKIGVLAVATALARNREVAAAMVEAGARDREPPLPLDRLPARACRGRARARAACGRDAHGDRRHAAGRVDERRPSPNTRRLIVEEGGFLYDRDALNDELPYWSRSQAAEHLVIPYSYETNDNRFDGNLAFATATTSSPT